MSDAVVKALQNGAKKLGKTLADDMGKAATKMYKQAGDNLTKTAKHHKDNDTHNADDFTKKGAEKAAPPPKTGQGGGDGGGGGATKAPRKYYVHDDGRVQEIRNGQLVDLAGPPEASLKTLLDGTSHQVKDASPDDQKKKYHAKKYKDTDKDENGDPKKDEKVGSRRIDGPTMLSRAVEEARQAQGDYKGKNYAAIRYKHPDGEEIVLVGRSGDRSHSERSIGKPLLGGREQYVSELYTERAPCQANENCERWLGRHFASRNPGLDVNHGVEYDAKVPKADRDWGHRAYVEQLKQDHGANQHGGTMGTKDFEAEGKKLKAAEEAAKAAKKHKGM
ncbi:nucleic acid/nucleotide deaminase domain-containing protein [Kitasatospora sp. NPDC059463]|uniref:nucleic acid/nucleotide deaminase domain-containing protein n=1 Tax=unclassified Kitasatospora TaxID=2633591 RepID=UPI0036B43007